MFLLVDKFENNYLIRGDFPLNNPEGIFQIQKMKEIFKEVIEKENQTFYENFFLEQVSFLERMQLTYYSQLNIQINRLSESIQSNLTHQSLSQMQIDDPNTYNFILRKFLGYWVYDYWNFDQIDNKISYLKQQLQYKLPNNQSKIIYFYCGTGIQNTGIISGSYKMKYHNWNFKQVMESDQITNITMSNESRKALNWFCWSLYYNQDRKPNYFLIEKSQHLRDFKCRADYLNYNSSQQSNQDL